MKKLFAGVIVSILLSAGLVAATSSAPSQAACPYTNCIRTVIRLGAPGYTTPNRVVRIGARVFATRGNARPRGVLRLSVVGPKVNRRLVFPRYNGRVIIIKQRFPRTGRYRIGAGFNAPPNSVFRDSTAVRYVRVQKRRR